MQLHSRNLLLQMLDKAKTAVADGERHLREQEARVVERNRTGRQKEESAKLLRNMRAAQSLMMSHVSLLESEIKAHGEAAEPAPDNGRRASLMTRLIEREAGLIASARSKLYESRELLERGTAPPLKPPPSAD